MLKTMLCIGGCIAALILGLVIYEHSGNHAEVGVARGIALLDEAHAEDGWRNRIDIDALHIQSKEHCILGQLYGSFRDGLVALELDFDEAPHYGFNSPFLRYRYPSLNREWRAALSR